MRTLTRARALAEPAQRTVAVGVRRARSRLWKPREALATGERSPAEALPAWQPLPFDQDTTRRLDDFSACLEDLSHDEVSRVARSLYEALLAARATGDGTYVDQAVRQVSVTTHLHGSERFRKARATGPTSPAPVEEAVEIDDLLARLRG